MKLSVLGVSLVALALAASSTAPAPVRGVPAAGSRTVASTQQTSAAPSALASAVGPSSTSKGPFQLTSLGKVRGRLHVSQVKGPAFRGGVRSKKTAAGASSSALRTPSSPRTVAIYNGLNKDGIKASDNAPSQDTPPDSTGAIGPTHYVEMSNSIIHVWDRNLNSVSAKSLASFLGAPAGTPLCDPQVQWDAAAGRWLYTVLFCNTQTSAQFLLFGWSKTSNPSNLATGWCTDYAFNNNKLLMDYPKLGHSNTWLIVGGNLYDESTPTNNPPFVGAGVAWVAPPVGAISTCANVGTLAHGSSPLPLTNEFGVNTFTPVPVNNASGSSDGYVVSAYDPSGGAGNPVAAQTKLSVFHLTALGVWNQDASITVNSFNVPTAAHETGGGTIDTLDARLTQAVGDPVNGIWTQHTVAGGGRSKVTWYQLKLDVGTDLAKTQEGDVADATDDIYNAAISPNWVNTGVAIFYNRSSSSLNPMIAGQRRSNGTALGTMTPGELVFATSPAVDADFSCSIPFGPPCRWGDYAGASPDPIGQYAVWGTSEYNTAATIAPAWRNRNFSVPAAPPDAPANVVGSVSGTDFACISWSTPTSSGTPILNYTINAHVGVSVAKSVTVGAPANDGCVTGLTVGVTYTFRILASNAVGPGPLSLSVGPLLVTRSTTSSTTVASPARTGATQGLSASPPPR